MSIVALLIRETLGNRVISAAVESLLKNSNNKFNHHSNVHPWYWWVAVGANHLWSPSSYLNSDGMGWVR